MFIAVRLGSLCALGCALLSAGCAGVWYTPYRHDAAEAAFMPVVQQDARTTFDYARSVQAPPITQLPDVHANYDKFLVGFAPVELHGTPALDMSAHYYRSRSATVRRLVIVLPIWGSYPYPPRRITQTLLRSSKGEFDVLHVLGHEPLFDWVQLRNTSSQEQFVQLAEQMTGRVVDAVIGIRQLVDWAQATTNLEVSVVGFSMSAIVAAVAMGVEDRIASGVLMMGAGNPAEVFATCNGKLAQVRDAVTTRFGWTQERYRALFERLFSAGDPRNFAGHYDAQNILIIDGMFDGCMSRDSRAALWEATGRPERVTFISNHKWSFISLTPVVFNVAGKKIYRFLSQHPGNGQDEFVAHTAGQRPRPSGR